MPSELHRFTLRPQTDICQSLSFSWISTLPPMWKIMTDGSLSTLPPAGDTWVQLWLFLSRCFFHLVHADHMDIVPCLFSCCYFLNCYLLTILSFDLVLVESVHFWVGVWFFQCVGWLICACSAINSSFLLILFSLCSLTSWNSWFKTVRIWTLKLKIMKRLLVSGRLI